MTHMYYQNIEALVSSYQLYMVNHLELYSEAQQNVLHTLNYRVNPNGCQQPVSLNNYVPASIMVVLLFLYLNVKINLGYVSKCHQFGVYD